MAKEDTFTEKEAMLLLKKYSEGSSEPDKAYSIVLSHSLAVKKQALKLLSKLKPKIREGIDRRLVILGAILHDIGRFSYPPKKKGMIKHGIAGARILRNEGLFRCAEIAERHVGVGITRDDIIEQKLPLPLKDYVPQTAEEKIVCYADKLISGSKVIDEEETIERFSQEVGRKLEKRTIEFFSEIDSMRSKKKK